MEENRRLENDFIRRINSFIIEKHLEHKFVLKQEPDLSEFTSFAIFTSWKPDFVILKGNYPYMIVEVLRNAKLAQEWINKLRTKQYSYDLQILGADYLILTDLIFIYILEHDGTVRDRLEFENIFEFFDDQVSDKEVPGYLDFIAQTIREVVAEAELPKLYPFEGRGLENLLETGNLKENIAYNSDGRFFHFVSNPEQGLEDFENLFFQQLLRPVTEQAVCRYTTLDSLFATLTYRSYRMASHIAMNDRGEVDYVDKYIATFYKPLLSMTSSEIEELNNTYISSCTSRELEDDLTMYRLYGDDSKGVCLVLNVANGLQRKNLLIKKISYAKPDDTHPELEIIKQIVNRIWSRGIRFRFLYMDVWKHFFKSKEYAVEKEVRLLFLDDHHSHPGMQKDWIIANPDRIISKFVTFKLDSSFFPLSIYKIILGPNCPEKAVNKRQIELLLQEKGISYSSVEISKIESYRKT